MKHSVALLLAFASLTACAREPAPTPAASSSSASAAPSSAAPTATAPTPTGGAASNAVTGSSDLTAQAARIQEGQDTPTATDSSEAKLERIAALPAEGQLPAGKWIAGTNYRPLIPAQPTSVAAGKVEVIEVFWYACPHCYALDPYLESWRKNKAAYIDFERVPVMWSDYHRATARLFYALQALGKEDALHTKVFDEIHQNKNPLVAAPDGRTIDEKETQRLQVAFARANGISEEDFLKAYNSFSVQTNMQKAEDLGRRYKVEGVPLIVINGKYETDVGMAGSQTNLIKIIDDLAASEKRH